MLNSLLSDSSKGATTTQLPHKLLSQLRIEGQAGSATAALLSEAAALLAKAAWQRSAAAADAARDSTFPHIEAIDAADEGGDGGGGREVSLQHRCAWLGAYSLSSIIWAEATVEAAAAESGRCIGSDVRVQALRAVDLALLRGGTHWNAVAAHVIQRASRLSDTQPPLGAGTDATTPGEAARVLAATASSSLPASESQRQQRLARLKRETALWQAGELDDNVTIIPAAQLYEEDTAGSHSLMPPRSLISLDEFASRYLVPSQPVILRGALAHWPAVRPGSGRCWADTAYLHRVAGDRLVPVEMCASADATQTYLSESFKQHVMPMAAFISDHVLNPEGWGSADGSTMVAAASEQCAYLAQHPLFDQIPALKDDIVTPELCDARLPDEVGDPDAAVTHVNAWFGPKGTVSPLHYDPFHNLLCQVSGFKYVRLIDAKHSARLYRRSPPRHNNSQVDLDDANAGVTFPLFEGVPMWQGIVGPGEALFIPRHCWHYVRSLTPSFSISFWWGGKKDMPLDDCTTVNAAGVPTAAASGITTPVAAAAGKNTGSKKKKKKKRAKKLEKNKMKAAGAAVPGAAPFALAAKDDQQPRPMLKAKKLKQIQTSRRIMGTGFSSGQAHRGD